MEKNNKDKITNNKKQILLLSVLSQLMSRGFSRIAKDNKTDDRLGITTSLRDIEGRYIEISVEKNYWRIFHYGFKNNGYNRRYIPAGFDLFFYENIKEYKAFLDRLNE